MPLSSPARVLVVASGRPAERLLLTALDRLRIPVDRLEHPQPVRHILGRLRWATVLVRLAGATNADMHGFEALARWSGRRVVELPHDAGLERLPGGVSGSERGRASLAFRQSALGEQMCARLGVTPPRPLAFKALGEDLRRRQDEMWTEMTWPPPDPEVRLEFEQELEAVTGFASATGNWALDVGAGAGRGAFALADRVGAVAAMDLSMEMLRRLRAQARASGTGRVFPVLGDAERLPFRDGVFSVATAIQLWAHLECPGRLGLELARVTRPGAAIALSTGNALSLIELHDRLILALHEMRHGRLRRAAAAMRGSRTYWLTLRGFARSSAGEVARELKRSGLRPVGMTGVGLLRTPRGYLPERVSGLPGLRRFGHLIVFGAQRQESPRLGVSYRDLALAALRRFVRADGALHYREGAGARHPDAEPPVYSTRQRYRLICLIGLESFRRRVRDSPALAALTTDLARGLADADRTLDDEGLFLWWRGVAGGGGLQDSLERLEKESPNLGCHDTQTLSFLLAGLTEATARADLAGLIADQIRARQGDAGLFATVSRRDTVSTFNYQVYASLALARWASWSGHRESREAARACARRLCELQGPCGQWWWTYDVRRGRIADRYPVFTVHQLGMAPLALFEVGRATGEDFSLWIRRGAEWVARGNEMGRPILSGDRAIVWRSVRRRGSAWPPLSALLKRLAWHRLGALAVLLPGKEINREHRPYEYGWLLAALAHSGGDESWLP